MGVRWAVPCVPAQPGPQFPQASRGPGPIRPVFTKHLRGAESWGERYGRCRAGAAMTREQHRRHAVGCAKRGGGLGEGDRSREHRVTREVTG